MWPFKKTNEDFQEIKLKCPRDGKVMRKVHKQDVTIDVCPKCNGIWLDDKEIDKLADIAKKTVPKKIKKKVKS